MLTLPDFKEKKIIFLVNNEDDINKLRFHNCNLRMEKNGEFADQISCHRISVIFIIGHCTLTSILIKKCREYGISLFLMDYSLKCYSAILSEAEGNYKLRNNQYSAKSHFELNLARNLIKNKVKNQYKLIKQKTEKELISKTLLQISEVKHIHSLLGIEGNFAKNYFAKMFSNIGWYRRSPQTREDIPNLLLDIGYSFLFNYVDALLKLFGFDTYKGFYHQLFFERKSLSCDIMEPMRPLIDKQLIKSCNLNQIDEKDFVLENGSFKFKTYDLSKKYTRIWFDIIMSHREEIYNYILAHYRFMMDSEKYEIPYFKFNSR